MYFTKGYSEKNFFMYINLDYNAENLQKYTY